MLVGSRWICPHAAGGRQTNKPQHQDEYQIFSHSINTSMLADTTVLRIYMGFLALNLRLHRRETVQCPETLSLEYVLD